MNYEGNIIRPPSEASSIILQVTVGCSHNKCTFCGVYKGVRFKIKPDEIIDRDLDFAARYCTRQKRLFLADGDALIIPQARLVDLLNRIKRRLPWVNRVSLYANAKAIGTKTLEELEELKSLGLDRVYMGLESGHDPTLKKIRKGSDSKKMIAAARQVRQAGLFLSVTVLLGIAGEENSEVHGEATGRVLTGMAPNQIAALTLMLLPNTPLHDSCKNSEFKLPTERGLLSELKIMIENIDLDRVQLQSNHASNYLAINGRLQRDKPRIIDEINRALAGDIALKPEGLRAL